MYTRVEKQIKHCLALVAKFEQAQEPDAGQIKRMLKNPMINYLRLSSVAHPIDRIIQRLPGREMGYANAIAAHTQRVEQEVIAKRAINFYQASTSLDKNSVTTVLAPLMQEEPTAGYIKYLINESQGSRRHLFEIIKILYQIMRHKAALSIDTTEIIEVIHSTIHNCGIDDDPDDRNASKKYSDYQIVIKKLFGLVYAKVADNVCGDIESLVHSMLNRSKNILANNQFIDADISDHFAKWLDFALSQHLAAHPDCIDRNEGRLVDAEKVTKALLDDLLAEVSQADLFLLTLPFMTATLSGEAGFYKKVQGYLEQRIDVQANEPESPLVPVSFAEDRVKLLDLLWQDKTGYLDGMWFDINDMPLEKQYVYRDTLSALDSAELLTQMTPSLINQLLIASLLLDSDYVSVQASATAFLAPLFTEDLDGLVKVCDYIVARDHQLSMLDALAKLAIAKTQNKVFLLNFCIRYASDDTCASFIQGMLDEEVRAFFIERLRQSETVFQVVANRGSVEVAKLLIERLGVLSQFEQEAVLSLQGPIGDTTLHQAVMKKDAALLSVLFESMQHVLPKVQLARFMVQSNRNGETTLHRAVGFKNIEAITFLLQQVVKILPIDDFMAYLFKRESTEKTAFTIAIQLGDKAFFQKLLTELNSITTVATLVVRSDAGNLSWLAETVLSQHLDLVSILIERIEEDLSVMKMLEKMALKKALEQSISDIVMNAGYSMDLTGLNKLFRVVKKHFGQDALFECLSQRGRNGMTLLHYTTLAENLQAFEVLLKIIKQHYPRRLRGFLAKQNEQGRRAMDLIPDNNRRRFYQVIDQVESHSSQSRPRF